jgi:heme oxygenase
MIRDLLRKHTETAHQQLESKLDLINVRDMRSYAYIIAGFYGFVRPLEARMVQSISKFRMLEDERLSIFERLKAPLLKDDLVFVAQREGLQFTEPKLASRTELPDLSSPASILGCLYVMEGSTLGGQFISAHFEKTLGLKRGEGLSYFSGYGTHTGKMWRTFLTILEESSENHPDWTDEVLSSANRTFEAMERWLV